MGQPTNQKACISTIYTYRNANSEDPTEIVIALTSKHKIERGRQFQAVEISPEPVKKTLVSKKIQLKQKTLRHIFNKTSSIQSPPRQRQDKKTYN